MKLNTFSTEGSCVRQKIITEAEYKYVYKDNYKWKTNTIHMQKCKCKGKYKYTHMQKYSNFPIKFLLTSSCILLLYPSSPCLFKIPSSSHTYIEDSN